MVSKLSEEESSAEEFVQTDALLAKGIDLPTKAGKRLYTQAMERQRRHEEMREEAWKLEESRFGRQVETRDCASESSSKGQDLSVEAGNRLYSQAIERLKRHEARRLEASEEGKQSADYEEKDPTECNSASIDLTVKAGNRLYNQAVEKLRRHEARRLLESQQSADNSKSTRESSSEEEETKMIVTGNRLYQEALAQLKRHEMKRMEAAKAKPGKLVMATQSTIGLKVMAVSSKSGSSDSRTEPEGIHRCKHLYSLSHEMQKLGKQRRTLIEKEISKAKEIPETKILPASKASDMYNRSVERLLAQKIRLAERAAELGY